MLKRISAYVLDFILLLVLITGIAFALSAALGCDNHWNTFQTTYQKYEEEYGVDFDISQEDYLALSDEARAYFDTAYKAFGEDIDARRSYEMLINLSLIVISISTLLGFMGLEFVVPMLFGNGQTVGKRVFGISVMQVNQVRISPVPLFVRTVLGKYTIETMAPLFIVMLIFTGALGAVGTVVLGLLLVLQIVMIVITKTNSPIHDLLASTVVVDHSSQLIFDSEAKLLEYKKQLSADKAQNSEYLP